MTVKELAKDMLYRFNPLAVNRRNKMRKQLVNRTPSLLCPNCIGGILFHDLGLQFRSPMVNLMMKQPEFVRFASNLEYYLQQDLIFYDKPGYTCPCAKLGDITIHFTHYATPEEAAAKWDERKNRIDWRNLFIFASERDGLTKEDLAQLGTIPCRGLLVFTANDYPEIPYALHIPKYSAEKQIGNILKKSWLDESREYEKYFDFVKWFNEASGAPYDISPFVK